jgi:hypothetical protein
MNTEFEHVVSDIKGAVFQSASELSGSPNDLRDILGFLTKVVQVVDQAFQDVYTLAVELAYVTAEDATSGRIRRLQQNLDLLVGRSHYRDAEEICSRLKHLRTRFEEYVRPAISNVGEQTQWHDLFWLIEEREGRIVALVQGASLQLRQELDRLEPRHIDRVNRAARDLMNELRPLHRELRELTNEVLGLSGRPGFLELTGNRRELARAASLVIKGGVLRMTNDTYNVNQAGAVGPGAVAKDVNFYNQASQVASQLDMKALGPQLVQLRSEMVKEAKDASHCEAIAAVAKAEEATKSGDGIGAVAALKTAGKWALDIATKIGVEVATRAIQGAMGL